MTEPSRPTRTAPPLVVVGTVLVGLAVTAALVGVGAWVLSTIVNDARDGMSFWEGVTAVSWFYIFARLAMFRSP